MVRVKTSIYIDRDLWRRFKEYALRKGVEVSRLLEEIIADEMIDDYLDKILLEMAGGDNYEIDFEPIEPKHGYRVSDLVRFMRDERANSISR